MTLTKGNTENDIALCDVNNPGCETCEYINHSVECVSKGNSGTYNNHLGVFITASYAVHFNNNLQCKFYKLHIVNTNRSYLSKLWSFITFRGTLHAHERDSKLL
jgi:hypothetical protein